MATTVVTGSFASIGADLAQRSIERVTRALQADLRQLDITAADYAHWDETYEFVTGQRPDFPEVYLTRAALDALRVDVIWILDAEGRTVLALDAAVTPVSHAVAARLSYYAPLVSADVLPASAMYLLRMPDGPLAVSVARILHSDLSGPSVGTLVFGRYVGPTMAERLAEISQQAVQVTFLDEQEKWVASLPEKMREWLSPGESRPEQLVITDDEAVVTGHVLLRDMEARPLAVLSTTVSRDVLQLEQRTIKSVVLALVVGFTVAVFVLLVLLYRSWLARAATQRQHLEHELKLSRLVRRDGLTGLANLAHLRRLLPRLMRRADRSGSKLALLHVDLDQFRHVNDSLGHASGDRLVVAIARRLREVIGSRDLLVRVAADEFVIVAMSVTSAAAVDALAHRLRMAIALPLEIDGVVQSITASIGICLYPDDGVEPSMLLKHADIALHQAKDRGRNNHQFFKAEMITRLRERLEIERALREALERDELYLEYQPCYDLTTLRPVSLEALLRWRSPSGTWIAPSSFIPIAEQSGLIVEIGRWVLRRVCWQLAEWQRAHVPLLPVSVNVSPRQFEQPGLAETVSMLTRELGVDANLLHFEITESAAMQTSAAYLGALHTLRNLGSRILVDDFGTGYSSLSYLKHLPIDTLKIDRTFVRDMAIDGNDAAIVSAIVGIARSLGLHVVAEGVESAEQAECLRALGCDAAQGFYFSPPIPAERCQQLLEKLKVQRSSEPLRLRVLGGSEHTDVMHLSGPADVRDVRA